MILEFSSINSMKACMKMGVGITLCPEISIRNELQTGEFARLDWDLTDTETSVLMITHSQKWQSPLLEHFLYISIEIIS